MISQVTSRVAGWGSSSIPSKEFDDWANEQLTLVADPEKASEVSFLKLAHILWAVSLNQSLQDDLFSNLEAANWTTDMTKLESIPRLTACVKEGIRWTGAASAMLPRIVPPGGSLLAGKQIPGGTINSSSPIWYLSA
ncbi:hypothetical protein PDIDSM_3950 [Penicillium digitatum]|nr:hypothetical protein PDIDSM_3950 [Penicillium digitatum]